MDNQAASPTCTGCRECGEVKMKVVDSRAFDVLGFETTRRKRRCLGCGASYHTVEIPAEDAEEFYIE